MKVDINEDLLTIMLLYSLTLTFENFRCAIESRNDLPKLESLKIKIIEESDTRKSKRHDVTSSAMMASSGGSSKNQKFKNRGKKPPNTNQEKKPFIPFKCHRCHKTGHKIPDCRVKNESSSEKAGNVEEIGFIATVINKESVLKMEKPHSGGKWCLDSGCTYHMCSDKDKFVVSQKCESVELNLSSSATTAVESKGIVKLLVANGDEQKVLNLENTLYVPDLRNNLFSVAKKTDKGYEVTFRQHDAVIQDNSKYKKVFAKRVDDLYYIQENFEIASVISEENNPSTLEI